MLKERALSSSGNEVDMFFFHQDKKKGKVSISSFRNGEGGYVHSLCIFEKHRNKGLGKSLMQDITEFGKKKGFRVLTLAVSKYNLPALKVYVQAGFFPTEDSGYIYQMTKELCGQEQSC